MKIYKGILLVATICLLSIAIWLFLTKDTHTPNFVDGEGNKKVNSIAEERMITLGGVEQYVLIRGENTRNPLLVFVHGGPGMTATPFLRMHNHDLEKDFVVVYWEQRGTNNSYFEDLQPESMTIDQITNDLGELVDQLTDEFGQQKVLLLGHSWGTVPALVYAENWPEKVAAYVAIAQTVDQVESDTLGYEWAFEQARQKQLPRSIETLEQLGKPPYRYDQFVTQRKQVNFHGGSMVEPKSDLALAWSAMKTPESLG